MHESLMKLVKYYYGYAKYNLEELKGSKGVRTFDYYCPFAKK